MDTFAARDELEPQRAFMRVDDAGAGRFAGNQEVRLKAATGQCARAVVAAFLAHQGAKIHVEITFAKIFLSNRIADCGEKRSDRTFRVGSAPAVQLAIANLAAERVDD